MAKSRFRAVPLERLRLWAHELVQPKPGAVVYWLVSVARV